MDKKLIFQVYNQAKVAARDGKIDMARLNRALGILQSKNCAERIEKYQASTTSCNCPDHTKTGKACKHMLAAMVIYRANNPKQAEPVKAVAPENRQPYLAICMESKGELILAEQIDGWNYRWHIFSDYAAVSRFARCVEHKTLCHPAKAHGRRNRDEVHNG